MDTSEHDKYLTTSESPRDLPDDPRLSEDATSLNELFVDPKRSLYEKKCMLVNREIDSMGLGSLSDRNLASWVGLQSDESGSCLHRQGNEQGNISIAFSAGLTAGRKWSFNLTVLFSSAFGLGLGGANDYNTFLVLAAFVGFEEPSSASLPFDIPTDRSSAYDGLCIRIHSSLFLRSKLYRSQSSPIMQPCCSSMLWQREQLWLEISGLHEFVVWNSFAPFSDSSSRLHNLTCLLPPVRGISIRRIAKSEGICVAHEHHSQDLVPTFARP
ncbi:hypothetical protein MRB53_039528 [Persea americana]|nr:hypothetical protein MRB53_039528 [Persea americana]